MAGADEGDAGRLRVGAWLPDVEEKADPSAMDDVTQALPIVPAPVPGVAPGTADAPASPYSAETMAGQAPASPQSAETMPGADAVPPVVRAVAKRAAAALPALGPATSRLGVPRSARATVDRTGRTAQADVATTEGGQPAIGASPDRPSTGPAGSDPPVTNQPVSRTIPAQVGPSGAADSTSVDMLFRPTSAPPTPATVNAAARDAEAGDAPAASDVAPVPPGDDAGEIAGAEGEVSEVTVHASSPDDREAGIRSEATPPTSGAPAGPPAPRDPGEPPVPGARAAAPGPGPTGGRPVISKAGEDGPGRERRGVPADQPEPTGRPPVAASVVGFAAAETDEWIMPGDADPGLGAAGAGSPERRAVTTPAAGPAPSSAHSRHASSSRTAELTRPGPTVLAADSWEGEPGGDAQVDDYQGRRRAASVIRLGLSIALAVVLLGAALALPLVLRSEPVTPRAGAPLQQAENGVPVVPMPAGTTTDGQLGTPVSAGPATNSLGTSTPTRTAGPVVGPGGGPNPTPPAGRPTTRATTTAPAPPPPTPTPPPSPFQPLTVQAESGTRTSSTSLVSCTEGEVVAGIGRWDTGTGTLTIPVSVPTAGTYAMTVFYAISGDFSRTAQISVNGGADQAFGFSQTAFSGCNISSRSAILLTLSAGMNTIRFANATARAPSIDKIVISRP